MLPAMRALKLSPIPCRDDLGRRAQSMQLRTRCRNRLMRRRLRQ
jgi:hypothetical protein